MSSTGVKKVIEATISYPMDIEVELSPHINIEANLSSPVKTEVELNIPQVIGNRSYSGEHVVIPNDEEQILETQGLVMNENVTIKPIPENYGKITWNGSILTVS